MAFSNQSKNTSSFGNQSLNTSSFSGQSKNASSFSGGTKHTSTIDDGVDFLLKEDTYFLLLETGGKIVLQDSENYKDHCTYTNQTKN